MEERSTKIFVVDDEEHISRLLSMTLTMAGFDVTNVLRRGEEQERSAPAPVAAMAAAKGGAAGGAGGLPAGSEGSNGGEGGEGRNGRLGEALSVEDLVERMKDMLSRSSSGPAARRRLSFADLEMDLET